MRLARVLLAVFVTIAWGGSAFAAASADRPAFAATASAEQPPPRLVLMDDTAELDAALAAGTPRRDVAVRVAGVSLPDTDPAKARLLILADIGTGQAAGALASVAYLVEDERGQARARGLRRRELPPTPSLTLAFSEIVALPPGSYRVKVAVMKGGKVGAAQAEVSVRVQSAANFRFGDVVLGEAAGEDLGSSLAFDRLIRGDRLVASLAFASTEPAWPAGLAITIEVAKDASGPAILSAPAAALPGQDAVRLAQAIVDVRALPPGSYVARAMVSAAGKEAGRASAPFTRERPAGAAAPASPAGPRSRGVAAPVVPGAAFRAEEVLDAPVLRPFLDDLASRATDRARPAIDQARAGRFTEAAQAAASADPNDPVKPFLLGLSLFSQRQLQAASEAFRETLRAAPDFFVGAFYIGACYAAGGRDPQAVNAWQTSLVGLDQYPIVFRLLAEALMRMGQPDRALEVLDEAVGKWPDDPAVRLRTARAALEAKRYDRVFALVDAATTGQAAPELLFAGLQAVYEQATQRADAPGDETIARARRYRDAYAAAGGTQQALVAEWVAAIDRKK